MRKKLIAFGIVFLVMLAGINIVKIICKDNQAQTAFAMHALMEGEYKVGDGEWRPITDGEHIPACEGDVVLKGMLHVTFPDGEIVGPVDRNAQVALYFDHIGGSVYINGEEVHVFDSENAFLGNATCGKHWVVYEYAGTETDIVEFHLTNPHIYGNECAIDEFLSSMHMYTGHHFEYMMSEKTESQRIMGYGIVFTAIIIIGIALFSTLIRLDVSKIMWYAGAAIFFAGTYFVADATNTYIWNMNIALTTTIFVLSIMLYGFFLGAFTSICFEKPFKKVGYGTMAVSGAITGGLLIFTLFSNTKLYDVFAVWIILQTITAAVLLVISCINVRYVKGMMRLVQIVFIISLIAMILDVVGTRYGWWQGCCCSSIVFIIHFFAALFAVLLVFPKSIRAALREKEMQAELEKSKTAVMFSQIQPHFLYNSLGAIRELCRQDPEDARNALGTFITYLRGNMDSIQREHTIHFSKELNHISAYLQLEKLRFGEDLNVVYDVQETDFFIPSLTIQPLVENAVKHGICGREDGGTVTLHTHREGDAVIVKILDDGVGFDVDNIEKLEHVGIKNVRNRLKYIVNGTLDIESKKDVGTTATITIHDRKD